MTMHAQLLRLEFRVCLAALFVFGLTLITSLLTALDVERVGRAYEVCGFCLWIAALFGLGPAHDHLIVRSGEPSPLWGTHLRGLTWLRPLGHLLSAGFFFALFCIAAFVGSESRALLLLSDDLRIPVWLLQSPAVVVCAMNVVRHSMLAVDDPAPRQPQ